MLKLGLVVIVACLISTPSVRAQQRQQQDPAFDTFRLISWCRQPEGTQNRAFCHGYVHAMAAAISQGFMALKVGDKVEVLEEPPAHQVVCIGDKVRSGQVALVFLLFTDKHPELLHKHPSILVAQAIAEAFPCPAR